MNNYTSLHRKRDVQIQENETKNKQANKQTQQRKTNKQKPNEMEKKKKRQEKKKVAQLQQACKLCHFQRVSHVKLVLNIYQKIYCIFCPESTLKGHLDNCVMF